MAVWVYDPKNGSFSCTGSEPVTTDLILKFPCITRFGGEADHVQVDATGNLSYVGASTRWEDSMALPNTFRTGGTALTFDNLTTNVMGYRFDTGDIVHLGLQLPHSMKVGSIIKPHLHLINKTNIGATGYNVGFNFTYIWASIGQVFAGEAQQLNVKCSFQNATALTHKVLSFADVTPVASQGGISSIFMCAIERVVSDAENYAGTDIFTGGFDIHFEVDTPGGSADPTAK